MNRATGDALSRIRARCWSEKMTRNVVSIGTMFSAAELP